MSQSVEEKISIYMEYMKAQTKKTMEFLIEFFRKTTIPMDLIFKIVAGPEAEAMLIKQKAILLEIGSKYTENNIEFQNVLDEY